MYVLPKQTPLRSR